MKPISPALPPKPVVLVRRAVWASFAIGLAWLAMGVDLWHQTRDLRGVSGGLWESAGSSLDKGGPFYGLLGLGAGASSALVGFFVLVILFFAVALALMGAGLAFVGAGLARRQDWARGIAIVIAWILFIIALAPATSLPLALFGGATEGEGLPAGIGGWLRFLAMLAGIPYFLVCLPLRAPVVKEWFRSGGGVQGSRGRA